MVKVAEITSLPFLSIRRRGDSSLARQVYLQIREAILGRRLAPDTRLPSTRALAKELGVSRNVALDAFEQLLLEGYIEGKVGSGTRVTALPEGMLSGKAKQMPVFTGGLSDSGARLAASWNKERTPHTAVRPFRTGVPALEHFPFHTWSKLVTRAWRSVKPQMLLYGDPAGYEPLRISIAEHLHSVRAVSCSFEQVIVTQGSQHSLDLLARLLLERGDAVWMEDPGYLGARAAFQAAGARVIPVPVDDQGLDLKSAMEACARPKLIYVTPSHQFPLGVTMSLERRLALIALARKVGAWIVEDDFNSEYRYNGQGIASLQGIDPSGNVIYLGTFSKVLFPGLRLGYMVAPAALTEAAIAGRALGGLHSQTLDQAVLSDFMNEGYFRRHIARMRMLYMQRQEQLLDLAARELDGLLELAPSQAGMHLIAWIRCRKGEGAVVAAAGDEGVELAPLSRYTLQHRRRPGVVLGYSGFGEKKTREAVARLARALE